MSKQMRAPGHEHPVERAGQGDLLAADHDPALLDELSFGNQALQAQLAGAAEDSPVGLDVVRDVALPLLERGVLALQILPRPGAEVSRFVEILSRSALPGDRVRALVDRLLSDQAAAAHVAETFQTWLGDDGEAWRSELVGLLEGVSADLVEGAPHGDGWALGPERLVPLSVAALDGSVAARAGALLADLVGHAAPESVHERLGGDAGRAVSGFCRSVVLALAFDEEEEEEEGGLFAPTPEEG